MGDDQGFASAERAAYAKLDQAIEALHELFASEDGAESLGDVPIDAVLLIGSQAITDDGHRTGCVTICPRGGWQPGYITSGLLRMAAVKVEGTDCNCCPDD